jgi:hypothetical protein
MSKRLPMVDWEDLLVEQHPDGLFGCVMQLTTHFEIEI